MNAHTPQPPEPFPPEKRPPFWPGEPPPEQTGERPIQPDQRDDQPGRSGIPPTRTAAGTEPVPPLPPSDDPPPPNPTLPPDPLHPPGAPVSEPDGHRPRKLAPYVQAMATDELDFLLASDALSRLRSSQRGAARSLR